MTNPAPVRSTANPSPVRRPGSIRRTASIDVTWPEGADGPRQFAGRARDIVRLGDGATDRLRAAASMQVTNAFDRTITAISADPSPPGLEKLVGARGGGHLRGVLRELLPDLIAQAHPLYLLLDDISGTSLISNWAWSQWDGDWIARMRAGEGAESMADMLQQRQDVCWGFREGSDALNPDKHWHHDEAADGKELRNPLDPAGWHDLPGHHGVSFRRARRIDVWREQGGRIAIEASFQDSAQRQDSGRAALHEYIVRASLDPKTLVIDSLDPEPRVLPFWDCPGAIANARTLIGTPLAEIRNSVLERLRGPQGCTHLNDALRSLAEVPQLLAHLDAELESV